MHTQANTRHQTAPRFGLPTASDTPCLHDELAGRLYSVPVHASNRPRAMEPGQPLRTVRRRIALTAIFPRWR